MMSGWRPLRGSWFPVAGGRPLDWGELGILVRGWGSDDRYHLRRAAFPDWEWDRIHNFFAAHQLRALQGANWQRSGGKGERPKLITADLLRGGADESVVSRSGVRGGRKRGRRAVAVSSLADLAAARKQLRRST